jgi:pyridoxal biosynthesis lyase PdxS
MNISSLPRKTFDAVERPVANTAESLLEKDAFMDALALAWKAQRAALRRVERGTAAAMRVVGVPTRADVVELVNQIGGLQRELRELRGEVESR